MLINILLGEFPADDRDRQTDKYSRYNTIKWACIITSALLLTLFTLQFVW